MSCLWFRWQAGRALDAGHPLAPSQVRHLAGCSRCRAAHAGQQRLVAALAAAADEPAPPATAVAALHARVMAATAPGKPAAVAQRRQAPIWAWAPAAAAALLLAGAGLLSRHYGHPSAPAATAPAPAIPDLFAACGRAALTLARVSEHPLQGEWLALQADAAGASRHLATCLPAAEDRLTTGDALRN